MKDKFFRAIDEYSMISKGDRVLVGVSGGADSMCLLSFLHENENALGISVSAAHINHCLRGKESDSDEYYVSGYCSANNIPLYIKRADINALSAESGESTELCARKVRYDFFNSLGFDKIATAHTGSDSIETVLMNMSRGSALRGVCGIPPVRDNIIRPLIFFTRSDTEKYCRENDIHFVTDSTNLSDDYTRNKYRHSVIPELTKINPAFEENMLRCISLLRTDEEYLSSEAKAVFDSRFDEKSNTLNICNLKASGKSIFARVLALYVSKVSDSDYESRHINMLSGITESGGSVTFPGGTEFVCDKVMISRAEKMPDRILPNEYEICKDNYFSEIFGEKSVCIRTADTFQKSGKNEYAVDFFKINDIIKLRSRHDGDEITLKRRRCTKSLKKLFNEMKIPVSQREYIAVLADDNGVIWVDGIGVNASRLPDDNTKKYLIINAECDKND